MSVKKGKLYEGFISEYRFPDLGMTEAENCPVLVKGTLPGQKVSFVISRKRAQGTSKGTLKEVIERSSLEDTDPECPYFGDCGGCAYRRLSYKNQLDLKASLVKGLLDKVYDSYEFEGIAGSPSAEGYRNKMEFSFGDECKDGPFALGLHKKGSIFDIINMRSCCIVPDDMNTVRNAVRDYFNELYTAGKVDFHNTRSHTGYLRHLLVRRSETTGEMLVALVTAPVKDGQSRDGVSSEAYAAGGVVNEGSEKEMIDGFVKMLQGLKLKGSISGAFHVRNSAMSDIVKNDGCELLFGKDYITETVLGLTFKISLFSFFQTNTRGAEVLYSKAREYATRDGGGTIYDLYCGTGTISQIMSSSAEKVIGVEIVSEAVEAARENAAFNGINNVDFIADDVMKVICGESAALLPAPDMIILDPPREGIHPKVLGRILSYGVDRIVYISCKPTSLAEELISFKAAGYKLVKAACVDMFPGTVHVECVALLSNRNAGKRNYITLDVDLDDYYRVKNDNNTSGS